MGVILSLAVVAYNKDSTPFTENHYNVVPTPSEIAAQRKQSDDNATLYALKEVIKRNAKDPSSVTFRNPVIYKNGVCIDVNAKNSFGGFTGFTEYCALTVNGKTKIAVDGVWKS